MLVAGLYALCTRVEVCVWCACLAGARAARNGNGTLCALYTQHIHKGQVTLDLAYLYLMPHEQKYARMPAQKKAGSSALHFFPLRR